MAAKRPGPPDAAPTPPRRPQPDAPPSAISAFSTAIGTVAIAIGIGVLGAHMLDMHAHTCEGCGHRWRHLGAFNIGDPQSHTCGKCGVVQWWKDGVPHVFRSALHGTPKGPAPTTLVSRLQEIRGVRSLALPSGASSSTAARGVTSHDPAQLASATKEKT